MVENQNNFKTKTLNHIKTKINFIWQKKQAELNQNLQNSNRYLVFGIQTIRK